MKHDISGLDKAKLLIALYDNAKNSTWTRRCLRNMPVLYRHKLELSEADARKLLSNNPPVYYLGPVIIRISFSDDTIDTSLYDLDNHEDGGAKSAQEVISSLRGESTPSCNIYSSKF